MNVKVISGSAVVTLTPSSGTIDGNANEPLTAKHSQTVVFDGTNWSTSGVYVVGPSSATVGDVATLNDTNGQSVADSGIAANQIAVNPPTISCQTRHTVYPAMERPSRGFLMGTQPKYSALCSVLSRIPFSTKDEFLVNISTLGTGPLTFALYTDAINSHKRIPSATISYSPAVKVGFTVTSTGLITAALGVSRRQELQSRAGLNWVCSNDTTSGDAVRFTAVSNAYPLFMYLVGGASPANRRLGAYSVHRFDE